MARVDRTNAPHHVYRCFDREGRLIYVGSSANLFGRLEQHRTTAWWAPTVAKVTANSYPNGPLARAAESRAIREEVPRWNKQGKWAGRDLWTRDDWHDWLTVLLRERWSNQIETSLRDYRSLFGEPLPDSIVALVEEVQERDRRQKEKWHEDSLRRAAEQAARETEELRDLNEYLGKLLIRQEALARALGVDWDDPEMCDPEGDIDRALAVKQREARGEKPSMTALIVAPNPLPSSIDWAEVETVLGIKIVQSPLQSDVVHSTWFSEGEGDLLGAVADEVDGGGEFPNLFRLRGFLEARGLCGSGGDVASGFVEGFATGEHGDSSSSVAGTPEGTARVDASALPAPCSLTAEDIAEAFAGVLNGVAHSARQVAGR